MPSPDRKSPRGRRFRGLEQLESRHLLSEVPGQFIVYKLDGGDVYRIEAQISAQPEDISTELNALSSVSGQAAGATDVDINISANGQWLAVDTLRFGILARDGYAGTAVVSADLKQGAAVIDGNNQVVHPEGSPAISSDGNLLVYSSGGGPHERDVWKVTRTTGGAWNVPVLLSGGSTYNDNIEPSLSADGKQVLFDGGTVANKEGSRAICQVGISGSGFQAVVTAANAPAGTTFSGRICRGHFASDGSVLFEVSTSVTDQIWRLPVGAQSAATISGATNEVSPVPLPDARIVSLWLERSGNTAGVHEITLRNSNGAYLFTLQPNVDIKDVGIGAGGIEAGNNAPVLDNSLTPGLPTIGEDATSPASVQVATLLKGAVTDPDPGALQGIAVTTAASTNGAWSYSRKGGGSWISMGTPSTSAALLIPGSAWVRFVPKANFNGTIKLWYTAWDQTQGTVGGTIKIAGNQGGAKSLSTAVENASLRVLSIDDRPVLSLGGTISYVHDKPAITLAAAAMVSDVDSADFSGGRLRVRIDVGGSTANRLAIGAGFTIDTTNNNVLQGTTVIGKRTSDGIGTRELIVTFNVAATPAIVQRLVRSITFRTSGGIAGSQPAVIFTVSDGDGAISAEQTKTVSVI